MSPAAKRFRLSGRIFSFRNPNAMPKRNDGRCCRGMNFNARIQTPVE
jgi:hypothetical protein